MTPAKRAFDVGSTLLGLAALWPVFAVIALVIKLDDGGPVFFRQTRVGRDGRTFRMVKFRTMTVGADGNGMLLTVDADQRVTRVGRWLRRTKLDELPQLLNVLAGQMSLVGPRPEVPRYVAHYPPEQRAGVLALTPGLTHPGIVLDEAALFADVSDPEAFYIAELIPEKNRLYLEYAARATLWTDLDTILQTLGRLLPRAPRTERHGLPRAQGAGVRAAATRAMVSTAARTSARAK